METKDYEFCLQLGCMLRYMLLAAHISHVLQIRSSTRPCQPPGHQVRITAPGETYCVRLELLRQVRITASDENYCIM